METNQTGPSADLSMFLWWTSQGRKWRYSFKNSYNGFQRKEAQVEYTLSRLSLKTERNREEIRTINCTSKFFVGKDTGRIRGLINVIIVVLKLKVSHPVYKDKMNTLANASFIV